GRGGSSTAAQKRSANTIRAAARESEPRTANALRLRTTRSASRPASSRTRRAPAHTTTASPAPSTVQCVNSSDRRWRPRTTISGGRVSSIGRRTLSQLASTPANSYRRGRSSGAMRRSPSGMPLPVLGGVLVLAAGLRLVHVGWGLPDYFFPDEAVFFRPATQVAATGDLRTGFTTYPPLSVDVLAATYALTARVRGVPVEQLAIAERVRLGRLVMVAAATASVAAVAALGAALAGPWTGLVAASFMAVLPVHVVQSRIISTDVLLTLLVVLALLATLRLHARPTLMRALACGAAVGLAAGTKYPGALAAAAPATVCLHGLFGALRSRDTPASRRWLGYAAAAALAAVTGFTLAYPHWIADADVLADRLRFLRFVAHEVGNDIARLSP